jgi:hypothetical protein
MSTNLRYNINFGESQGSSVFPFLVIIYVASLYNAIIKAADISSVDEFLITINSTLYTMNQPLLENNILSHTEAGQLLNSLFTED